MKKIAALLLNVVCVFSLMSCGENSENNKNTDWTIVKQATCTSDGIKEKYIEGTLVKEPIAALGHDYGEWVVTLHETCTIDGKEERQCSRCSEKEEKVINAHHVLKEGYKFDMEEHYYECENCTEKINLANHDLEIEKENKYMYLINTRSEGYRVAKFNVGYVSTLTCKDCEVKIKDLNLIKEYNSKNYGYSHNLEEMGADFEHYNLLHSLGSLHLQYKEGIHFEYDSNYNLTKVVIPDSEITDNVFIYEYDDNNFLKSIDCSLSGLVKKLYINFEYSDSKLVKTTLSRGENNEIHEICEYDENEYVKNRKLYYTNQNQMYEFSYLNGYLKESKRFIYTANNELDSEVVTTYNLNINGNIITTSFGEDTLNSKYRSTTYEHNDKNLLTRVLFSGTNNGDNGFSYEYIYQYDDQDRLTKIEKEQIASSGVIYNYTYTYTYNENKVVAYCDNNVVLEIEYLSEYKMVD